MVLFARDIVEPDFVSLPEDTDALEAAKKMKTTHHGFVVVVSPDGIPKGIVTEWDYLSKVVAENLVVSQVKLKELMSTSLVTVSADEGIDEVVKTMAEKGIRRVLVLDKGKVIGAITSRTVLRRLEEYIDKISTQIARLNQPLF